MKADLHTHSNASDGTDAPAELIAAAQAAGLDLLALTDHDTFAAVAEAGRLASARGIALLPGAELTCVTDTGVTLHLLAYAPSPADPVLAEQMARVRDDRGPRARRIVEHLAADGVDVSYEQVAALAGGAASVGRPHVAQALVDAGAAASIQDAFDRFLAQGRPYYEAHHAMPVLDAIGWVRAAGGVPVFAHSLARRRGPVVSESDFEAMVAAGLLGVEVDHVDHEEGDRERLRAFARAHDLIETGSSDYHGARKEGLGLGAHTTAPEQLDRLLAAADLTLADLQTGAASARYATAP
jgi:hypothetical protein